MAYLGSTRNEAETTEVRNQFARDLACFQEIREEMRKLECQIIGHIRACGGRYEGFDFEALKIVSDKLAYVSGEALKAHEGMIPWIEARDNTWNNASCPEWYARKNPRAA